MSPLVFTLNQLLTYNRRAVQWFDQYKVPERLQGKNADEADQRESEKTSSNSVHSSGIEANSGLESHHDSDHEPAKPHYPDTIPLRILRDVYTDFPAPLGVYVQFDSLLVPDTLDFLDQHQPAVYGYFRYCPINSGNKYDGWDVDISRTGKTGRWVLGARISDHTMDGRLIGRPLNRDRIDRKSVV